MIKKIINYLKEDIKENYVHYIILLFFILLITIKFDYYVYSPGSLVDLTDRIEVENSNKSEGSFNLTYVTARNGIIPNILLSHIIPSWDLVELDKQRIENESENEIVERDKVYLKETSYDAIIAAFAAANMKYSIDSIDLTITFVYDLANTNLKVGDIIRKINNVEINTFDELRKEIEKYKEKDKITLEVLRHDKLIECYSVLQKEKDRLIIGVTLAELKNITTNPKVNYIFKDNESGSSRGLMCALDIYNKITEFDLTKGKIISGTGSIDENGKVGPIDGVKYKLLGAVKNNADIFIVPSENYEEAIKLKNKYNYNIEIIEADTLTNVIEKLK